MRRTMKLIILGILLIESFIFKGKHFIAFSVWFGDILGKILTNLIMKNY